MAGDQSHLKTNESGQGRGASWLFAAILLVAAFLRLYRLDTLPAGLNGDELFNAIDALKIGKAGWPIYFPGNNGREVFFHYLLAGSLRGLGNTIFALRLPAALLGIGSVALVYVLSRDLLKNRTIALLASWLIAVSIWPIMHSRWSLRAISLPFLCALAVWLIGRGLEHGRQRDWLAGGIAFGLVAYTYIPARAFPLVLLGWWFALWFWDRETVRRTWRQAAASLALALLVFAPFGWYAWQNPAAVNSRVNDLILSPEQTDSPIAALPGLPNVVRMFSVSWDDDWRYHLADQPLFDPITSVFFYLGCAVALAKILFEPRGDRATYAMLLLWLGGMLSPNLFAPLGSSALRAAGAAPPIYLLTGVGLAAVLSRLADRRWRVGLACLAVLYVSLLARRDWQTYATDWVNHPDNLNSWQADLAQMITVLDGGALPADGRVFMAYEYIYDLPTQYALDLYTDTSVSLLERDDTIAWHPAQTSYLVAPSDYRARGQIELVEVEALELATLYAIKSDVEPTVPIVQTFENAPTLLGYDLSADLIRGSSVDVALHWQIPAGLPTLANELLFVQLKLVAADGAVWQRTETLLGYPQASWQTGDRFVQTLALPIPDGVPPGDGYQVQVALSQSDGATLAAGLPVNAQTHRVQSAVSAESFVPTADQLVLGNLLAVQAVTLSTLIQPGIPVDLAIDWVAVRAPAQPLMLALELIVLEQTEPVLVQTVQLGSASYPAEQWLVNESVRTQHRLIVPADLPTEADPQLRLRVLAEGESLSVTQGDPVVAQMEIDSRERLFTSPLVETDTVVEAEWEDGLSLLGYALDLSDASAVRVRTIWQAETVPSENYTIFTHLLRADGSLVAQYDGLPSGEAWLTTTWLPQEYVIDERTIALDAPLTERVSLVIGLYDSETVIRLPLVTGETQIVLEQLEATNE